MRPGFDVPPLMFDRSELAALVAGERLVEAWGGSAMARAASDALAKISALVPESTARAADSTGIQAFDPQAYRLRNLVERASCRLKDWRRIATRYDKLKANDAAAVAIACLVTWWM